MVECKNCVAGAQNVIMPIMIVLQSVTVVHIAVRA